MSITKEQTEDVVEKYGGSTENTGSTEAQIAILSTRINNLKDHFSENHQDHSSRRGLLKMVGRRRRLLTYLKNTDIEKYRSLIKELGIRK